MRSRRLILCLIIMTLLATVLAAAAKLRATPKYNRIQVGMTMDEVASILAIHPVNYEVHLNAPSLDGIVEVDPYSCDEGVVFLKFRSGAPVTKMKVVEKRIERRGPLERLAWLAGWR